MTRTTTVAHVVLHLKVGGLERVVVNLVRGFRDSPYRCIVCCLEERGEFADEVEGLGAPVYVIGKLPGIDWRASFRLSRLFRTQGVEIVHSHNTAAHLSGLTAAMLAGAPWRVHTRHGRNYPDDRRQVLLNRVLSWRTHLIVPVSEDAQRVALEREHIDPHRMRCIPNGVDCTLYRPIGDVATRPPIIGTVARLSPEKDQQSMLAAFSLVLKRIPEARLILAGSGPCEQALRETAATLGISRNVEFVGVCHDVPQLLSTLSLFTLSSTTEGLSMTLLEAMAAGLPSVSTDVGGNRQVVDPPECGMVVPVSNPRALAAAYLDLLTDSGRRARMSFAARARAVAHFSVENMINRYRALYDGLLTGTSVAGQSNS